MISDEVKREEPLEKAEEAVEEEEERAKEGREETEEAREFEEKEARSAEVRESMLSREIEKWVFSRYDGLVEGLLSNCVELCEGVMRRVVGRWKRGTLIFIV